jgi:hypothetical protein
MMLLWGALAYLVISSGLLAAAYFGGRSLAALLGVPHQWFGLRSNAPLAKRLALRLGAWLCAVALCILAIWSSLLLGGTLESTTSVEVLPGTARNAGVLDGDQVLAVDGKLVSSFDELREKVATGRDRVELRVLRQDQQHTILVPLGTGSRIGVAPVMQRRALGPFAALQLAVPIPFKVMGQVLAVPFRFSSKDVPELKGPVAIVKDTSRQRDKGSMLYFFGLVGAFMSLWLPALFVFEWLTLRLFERTHRAASSDAAKGDAWRLARLHQALVVALLCSVVGLPLQALAKLGVDSPIVALLAALLAPASLALWPLVGLGARGAGTRRDAILGLAVSALVPCLVWPVGYWVLGRLGVALRSRGFVVGWWRAVPRP